VEQVCGLERRSIEALGAGDIEIGFVDGGHFDQRGKVLEHGVDLLRIFAVAGGVAVDEDGLRAEFVCGAQGHGGVDAEFARGVGGGGNYAALVGAAADDDGLAFEGRVVELFHGNEEGVHVDVEEGAHWPSLSN
jgi:hypothetical protein